MSFSSKSDGLLINPGGELKLPIPVPEPSVLSLQWECADQLDVEFSVRVTPASGEDARTLVGPERLSSRKDTVEIEHPGSCLLEWNNCYGGWLGGSARKLSYAATLQSKQEIAEEERRKNEAIEAERLRQAAILEEERKREAAEKELLRRAERDAKIPELRARAAEYAEAAMERADVVLHKEEAAHKLREELTTLEASIATDRALSEEYESQAAAAREEADALDEERRREQDEDAATNGKEADALLAQHGGGKTREPNGECKQVPDSAEHNGEREGPSEASEAAGQKSDDSLK